MNEKNPWKTLATQIVYQNPWITVREDQVIRPDGSAGIYSVVETRIATGVVAIEPSLEVYLVGQYRYATSVYSWEIIEGGADPEESALSAAKRELEEEAGLIATSWTQLGQEVHLTNCHSSEVAFVYLAENLSYVPSHPEVTEVLSLKKLPIVQCLEMIESGVIKDAVSIIGLERAAKLLRERGLLSEKHHSLR